VRIAGGQPPPEALGPGGGPVARGPRFPALEGVRALAALSIIAYHVGELGQTQGQLSTFGQRLTLGVPVFFVVSAFVLYRPFVAHRADGRPLPAIGPFLLRRAVRILPLFWVTMTVVWVTSPLLSASTRTQFFGGVPWWRYYLFTQVYTDRSSIWALGPAWSLNVEMAFYLVLPFWALAAAWLIRRKVPVHVELVCLGLVVLSATSYYNQYEAVGSYLTRTPWANAGYFSIGMVLAIVSVDLESTRPIFLSRAVRFVVPFAATGIAVIIAVFLFKPVVRQFGELRLALVSLVLLPAAFDHRPVTMAKRILMQPHIQRVGVLSYGVYLFHRQIALGLRLYLWAPMDKYDYVVALTAVIVLTVVLASASYRYLELPLIRRAGKVGRPDRAVPAQPGPS